MSWSGLQIESELAYDLMQDNLEAILTLLDGPLPRRKVAELVGSDATVDRLIRHGLVRSEGRLLYAAADSFHQLRRESMVSFLQRYVLPSLTATIDGSDMVTLAVESLALPATAMQTLRAGPVQALFEDLIQISKSPTHMPKTRLSVLIVGTSETIHDDRDLGEKALALTKNASIQRSKPDTQPFAMLSQYDCLADSGRHAASARAVAKFIASLAAYKVTDETAATYQLVVATHWRCLDRLDDYEAIASHHLC